MGLFLLGTGINQEVSGSCWIWAVALFTDDWLASQNHQIHLPTVTFITVIFKVTATCLVSQHCPPHIYSHLPSLTLYLSPSLVLSLHIWSVALLLFLLHLHLLLSPAFNYFYLTFLSVSLTRLGRLRVVGSGRCEERQRKEGSENKTPPPTHFPLSEGCVLNPHIVRSPEMARNSFCTVPPLSYTVGDFFSTRAQDGWKWKFWLRMCWSYLHGSTLHLSWGIIYFN